jgi:hypothetical protein
MPWIVGTLVQLITFPGTIMKTIAMRFFCDLAKVAVYDVKYFKGELIHGPVANLHKAFIIALAPIFLNTLLCAILTFPVTFSVLNKSDAGFGFVGMFTLWLGVSMGMHAFPNETTIDHFLDNVDPTYSSSAMRFLYKTLRWLFWLVNKLRFFWIDAIYTLGIALILPMLMQITSA